MVENKDTKSLLAASAIDLMRKMPWERITVSDIMKNCGMCRETFYYHFADKYELLCWLFENRQCQRVIDDFSGPVPWEGLVERCVDWLRYFRENRDFVQNALSDSHPQGFRSIVCDGTYRAICSHARYALSADALEKELVYSIKVYTYGIVSLSEEWLWSGLNEPDSFIGKVMARSVPANLQKVYLLDKHIDAAP